MSHGFSLREQTKKRLLDDMIRSVKPANGLKILLLDAGSTKIISAACRMFDIIEEGVTLVEPIQIKRQPLPKLEAIYFLTPIEESIQGLIEDFSDAKHPQYAAAHLFFTRALPDNLFEKLKASPALPFIKGLKEINLDYVGAESLGFHLDMNQSFYNLFSPESKDSANDQHVIAEKIATLCASLNEYPIVRYQAAKNEGSSLTTSLARLVQEKLDRLARSSNDFKNSMNLSNRSTLLILDRSVDPMAPLLHEFTYQAMIYDLLNPKDDNFTWKAKTNNASEVEKKAPLSEMDPLWTTLRHMHIAETMTWLIGSFNDFVKENKATKLTSGKKIENLREMSEAMKAMPMYKEMLEKYSLHINMSERCMNEFNLHHLSEVANLEQDMSTGEDSEGKPAKNVISGMPKLLIDPDLTIDDKLRLLMLYIISMEGIKDSDRKRLIDLAHITAEDQGSIANLRYLGVTLMKGTKAKKTQKVKKDKKSKERTDAPPFELSRYVPVLKTLGQDMLENSLNTTEYPYLKEGAQEKSNNNADAAVSYRSSAQPKWADKNKRKSEKPASTGSRVIMFVAGGVTFSELRAGYELSDKFNREVIVGGTSLLTPLEFVSGLKSLKRIDLLNEGV
eukprot:TRINITY_DN1446_c0_g1_i1.p1 TRINITY_DN1446_c0_g1~~TRINITY_DN1446_c0_g1_i1.p1  ORF type:complete len:630 (-),score=247.36 TRINITY_DN1446_c0_g1_i1:73-1929(-)